MSMATTSEMKPMTRGWQRFICVRRQRQDDVSCDPGKRENGFIKGAQPLARIFNIHDVSRIQLQFSYVALSPPKQWVCQLGYTPIRVAALTPHWR